MIEITVTILFVIFLGSINSLLSYLLDYCFWDGSIFSLWLPTLAKWNLKIFKPEIYAVLIKRKKNEEYENDLVKAAHGCFFFKILGGCIICTNIWLAAFTFTTLHFGIGISFWYSFPYILFSSFFLRKIS